MSDALCLKVRWGPTKSYKLMNFDSHKTCLEVVEEVKKRYTLSNESFRLYSPPNETRGPLWLESTRKLISYCDDLKDRDIIEMKFKPETVYFCSSEGHSNWLDSFNFQSDNSSVIGSLDVDFVDAINEYIPSIRNFIKSDNKELVFQHVVQENGKTKLKWLNSNVSFLDQDITEGSFIHLCPVSYLTSSKQNESIISAQEDIDISGTLIKKSIKTHKVTNPKKRWCCLRGNFLFYFASQSQQKANGVIPVEYYDLEQSRNKQKYEIRLKHKEGSFISGAPTYVFEFSDQAEQQKWINAIIRKCVIGAGTTVFGVSLSKVMARKNNRHVIPAIISQAVEFLESRDRIKLQGLFRISGSSASVMKFKDEFDRGLTVKFEDSTDPHVVAGLLKLYVRELPDPLLPFESYNDFISINEVTDTEQKIEKLQELIRKIPEDNHKVLVYLLNLLKKISEHHEVNLMTVTNLAVVFGPNILRPKIEHNSSDDLVGATTAVCAVTELLISEKEKLFRTKKIPPLVPKRQMASAPVLPLPGLVQENQNPPTLPSTASPSNVTGNGVNRASRRSIPVNSQNLQRRKLQGASQVGFKVPQLPPNLRDKQLSQRPAPRGRGGNRARPRSNPGLSQNITKHISENDISKSTTLPDELVTIPAVSQTSQETLPDTPRPIQDLSIEKLYILFTEEVAERKKLEERVKQLEIQLESLKQ